MWHGTGQQANEDGCSRWEALETQDACHRRSQWAHRVGGTGPQAFAHGPGQTKDGHSSECTTEKQRDVSVGVS